MRNEWRLGGASVGWVRRQASTNAVRPRLSRACVANQARQREIAATQAIEQAWSVWMGSKRIGTRLGRHFLFQLVLLLRRGVVGCGLWVVGCGLWAVGWNARLQEGESLIAAAIHGLVVLFLTKTGKG
ncbi:hypothetical protein BJX64DRAFT_65845 [Aspergillus heterothallicus]